MARRVLWPILAACALAATGDSTEVRQLDWDDLLPPDQELPQPWVDHSVVPSARSIQMSAGGVVPELNGQIVKIPGFIIPLDLDGGKVTSSLLVPYFGACIHVPPPPPNQIVHVKFEKPIEIDSMWDPVWVTGRLGLERFASELAVAGYSMQAEGVEKYRY